MKYRPLGDIFLVVLVVLAGLVEAVGELMERAGKALQRLSRRMIPWPEGWP